MGLMDSVKGKGDDEMRDRYEQLKTQAQNGDLTDESRDEYERLRNHYQNRGS
jgi:hypothetical protein